jgi:hypothetical protein
LFDEFLGFEITFGTCGCGDGFDGGLDGEEYGLVGEGFVLD